MSAVPATGCGLGKALDTFELMFTDVVFKLGSSRTVEALSKMRKWQDA